MVASKKWTLEQLHIETDYGDVPTRNLKWLPAFANDTPDEVLRKEFAEKGVVHMKGVMPRDYVLGVRGEFFSRMAPSGVLKQGSDPTDGTWCGEDAGRFVWPRTDNLDMSDTTNYSKLAADWHTDDASVAFCENPHIMKAVSRLQPGFSRPFCLRRQIFRSQLPQTDTKTGIHYDQIFLRHGLPDTTMTAWVPVGDIKPHEGGLIYLEGSVASGKKIEDGYTRMSEAKGFTDEESKQAYNNNMTAGAIPEDCKESLVREDGVERRWYVGNYEAGDLVFHDMYMIHASGKNLATNGRIRLSVDLRFADRDQTYDPRWTRPFIPGDML